jgi:hypothetical protein
MKRSPEEHAARFDGQVGVVTSNFAVTAVEQVHEQAGVVACTYRGDGE